MLQAGIRKWSIEDAPADTDLAVVSAGIMEFARAEAVGGDPRPLACFLREGEIIIAGATGRVEFGRLFVGYLWVREELRGAGIGGAVLKRIECAAQERGARDALIETMSHKTANLYRRCGYVDMATIPRYVGSFTRYVMLKTLADWRD
jgi:ribosomal protein S18 acetylase RimI-like enzyme